MYRGKIFEASFAVSSVNQIIRGTSEILMDSSGLSSVTKGVGGCIVDYEFTRFASSIIKASYFWWRRRCTFECFNFSTYEGIAKVARSAIGKKAWIFKGVFAASDKNRIILFMILLKLGRLGL